MAKPKFHSLQYFTEKAKARLLWRLICRTAFKAPHKSQRDELLKWAKSEFVAHKNEEDPMKIRYLVSDGLKRTREMAEILNSAR